MKSGPKKWYFVTKIVLTYCDREKLLKFEAEGREFAKFLRSLEQFIQVVKGQNIFGNRILFKLVPGVFSYLIKYNNLNSNWKNYWDLETCRKS